MKKSLTLSLLVVFFLVQFQTEASAEPQCISGNPKQTQLLDQMVAASNNPATATSIIFAGFKLGKKTESSALVSGICEDESCKAKISTLEDMKKFAEGNDGKLKAPEMVFKTECMAAGNKFEANTAEIACPSGKRSSSGFDFCISEDFLSYQNALVSSFKSCAQKLNFTTLDTEHLFKIYARESTFKPHYASVDGIGFGQLTSTFVLDIHQKHRGLDVLKSIATSQADECKAAQIIAKKDVIKAPSHSNTCAFISVGEGLERNILYSIVGLATSWEKDIEPLLTNYIADYKDHPKIEEVKNLALLNSYGPGRADARAVIKRLVRFPPDRFVEEMKKPQRTKSGRSLTRYVKDVEDRQKKIRDTVLTEPLKSAHAAEGAKACINTF